jgi:TetR/AcrR family transcriptional repressor of mexJK operon
MAKTMVILSVRGAALKTWSSENPKASLMQRKQSAIVRAARNLFLDGGYAKTSMDSIAEAAGVGIKTVYRHFLNKDDLFSAVMQAACHPAAFEEPVIEEQDQTAEFERPWFTEKPDTALVTAGTEFLQHVLSEEQLALYRVVTQDAHRFHDLGRRYKEQVIDHRNEIFIRYLNHWAPIENWKVKDHYGAANTFTSLLRAGIFDDALHGLRKYDAAEIAAHARCAAEKMLVLLKSGIL